MRTILTPAMMEVLGRNFSRNIDAVRAFEIGNTFTANLVDPEALPDEQDNLCIGMYGAGADFFYLKGMIETLLAKLGIKDLQFIAESEYGVYHPGRCARIVARHIVELENGPALEEVELGIMGEVHPEVADKYGIGTRCYAAELMFNTVTELSDLEKVFSPLPKYPATSRDIALLVDEDMLVGDIENVIRAAGTEILRDVKLFDIYRGKQVEEGKKSVAFNLTYRHNDRTLTDEDVNAAHGQVLQALKDNLDAVLREM
jgi:phenylalanyl-tRNA synthetase beta chain